MELDFSESPYSHLLGHPWIGLSFLFLLADDVIVVPFDRDGSVIDVAAQATTDVEAGQHVAMIDAETGEAHLATVGPVSAADISITIADVVTLARAHSGQIELSEAQRFKYGIIGPAPTIMDLVRLARTLNA